MRFLFSAGEASGDAYGAAFATELRKRNAEIELEGIGGPLMRQAGVKLLADSSDWGAIGIFQAIKVAPKILIERRPLLKAIETGPPGVFVPIDFGALNIGLAKRAKAKGWKVFYFIPPGSWRKSRVGKDLPEITDWILSPFEWNEKLLRQAGANAKWFGHPILQLIGEVSESASRGGVVVLPGSRKHEIQMNLPVIAGALSQNPERLSFLVAASLDLAWVEGLWRKLAPSRSDAFTQTGKYELLKRANLAVVCSGTATLESVLCGAPTVVLYKLDALSHLQGYLMGMKGSTVALPNILLGRRAVPEVVGREVTANQLADAFQTLLEKPDEQVAAVKELRTLLGSDKAISQAADWILKG